MLPRTNLTDGHQTLLIDADDTLWENNVYFERAIANFISFLNHHEYSPDEVRQVLNDVERESIVTHGYGLHSFAHSLVRTFERLAVEPLTPALKETIHGFAYTITTHPMEIIRDVPETLAYLTARHFLMLVTKGAHEEQAAKIERSGLKEYFAAIEIVAEKDESIYRGIVSQYALTAEVTWMVGNSPKSDINPALSAGLNAVFVPHGNTWILEHDLVTEPQSPSRLIVVENFRALRNHF